MKRLNLILNGKGGVGKSFFAVNLVQFLKDKGIAYVAIDSDNENSTLKRFHSDTRFLDLDNHRELDGIFGALEKASLVVMDCRAASTDLFSDYFTEIDLPAVLTAMSATLALVMPVNHESDSVDQLQRLTEAHYVFNRCCVCQNWRRFSSGLAKWQGVAYSRNGSGGRTIEHFGLLGSLLAVNCHGLMVFKNVAAAAPERCFQLEPWWSAEEYLAKWLIARGFPLNAVLSSI